MEKGKSLSMWTVSGWSPPINSTAALKPRIHAASCWVKMQFSWGWKAQELVTWEGRSEERLWEHGPSSCCGLEALPTRHLVFSHNPQREVHCPFFPSVFSFVLFSWEPWLRILKETGQDSNRSLFILSQLPFPSRPSQPLQPLEEYSWDERDQAWRSQWKRKDLNRRESKHREYHFNRIPTVFCYCGIWEKTRARTLASSSSVCRRLWGPQDPEWMFRSFRRHI